jgi:hypothetical protein
MKIFNIRTLTVDSSLENECELFVDTIKTAIQTYSSNLFRTSYKHTHAESLLEADALVNAARKNHEPISIVGACQGK